MDQLTFYTKLNQLHVKKSSCCLTYCTTHMEQNQIHTSITFLHLKKLPFVFKTLITFIFSSCP